MIKAVANAVALLFLALPAFSQTFINPQIRGPVSGSTVTVVSYPGAPLDVNCLSGCSGGASGATTVTPGTGTWLSSQSGSYTVTPGTGTFLVNGSTLAIVNASGQSISVIFPSAQAVTVAALPLPAGAATEATLASLDGKVTAVNTGAITFASPQAVTQSGAWTITVTASDLDIRNLATTTDEIKAEQKNSFTVTPGTGAWAATQSGTWNIGSITTLPSIPTGTNNIGTVNGSTIAVVGPGNTSIATESTLSSLNGKVTAVNTGAVTISAALPSGTNILGGVNINSQQGGALNVKSTDTVVTSLPAIPAGTNNIGTVNLASQVGGSAINVKSTDTIITSLPALVAGTANIGRVNGSTIAVQCLNAAGTAFESCAGGGSSSGVQSVFVSSGFVNIISTFAANNPGFVQLINSTSAVVPPAGNLAATVFHNVRLTDGSGFYSAGSGSGGPTTVTPGTGTFNVMIATGTSQAASTFLNVRLTDGSGFYTAGSGSGGPTTVTPGTGTFSVALASITYTGTSANVNCTGGCGSPTQAASFIAVATVTLLTGATHFVFFNHSGSTAIIKVQRIEVGVYGDAAIVGVVTGFHMYQISNATATSVGIRNALTFRLDETKNAIAPGVTISTGGAATVPTLRFSNAFASVQMTSEETTLTNTATLYDYRNLGDTPLRLAAGNGFAVKQALQPAAAAGKVIIRAFFTQE